jgi:predicted HTH transcriptional regulator
VQSGGGGPTVIYSEKYLAGLARELCKTAAETEWIEFKHNKADPEEIGEQISALSNSAALNGKAHAYLLWGIDDGTHEMVGTSFNPSVAKMGNEALETWLLRLLAPKINFRFHAFAIEDKPLVLLEIPVATSRPVSFRQQEFIRIGSIKKKLKDYPEKERELWRVFDNVPFERGTAANDVSGEEVLMRLDYPAYFDLLDLPLPDGRSAILETLESDGLIVRNEAGNWGITRLGGLLLAKKLDTFPDLRRKAARVIHYKGRSRVETLREHIVNRGYANGFKGLIDYIMASTPSKEEIRQSLRVTIPWFPEIAVRELVANALIHQDFFVTGAGPMIEIFEDRMEITNPGEPLVNTNRFLDSPPKSRNETLAALMRRFQICEERGSGIDKVVFHVECLQLPAPAFEQPDGFTKATLFAPRPLGQMDKNDRLRACYFHACLKWASKDFLTNASLRQRLGVQEKNKATVSRYIREAVKEGVIRPFDKNAPSKLMKYWPFWA